MRMRRRFMLALTIAATLAVTVTSAAHFTIAAPLGSAATSTTAATATGAASSTAQSVEKFTLQFKYEAGDEIVFEQVVKQEIAMRGMQSIGGNEITSTMRWKVLDVADNGDATIDVTTDRVHGTVASPSGVTSFDSASEEQPADQTARILTAQAGTSFRLVLAPNGDVVRIEFADEMRNAALEAMPEDQRAAAAPMFDEMFTDEAMENMLRQGFQSFPEEPVGAGDSWDRSMSMKLPMIGTMTTDMTMTLDRFEERDGTTIAVIGWTGSTSLAQDSGGGFPGTIELSSSEMTGTSEFDVDRGVMLTNMASSVMQMAMSTAGQEMVMDMDMNMSFRLVEGGQ